MAAVGVGGSSPAAGPGAVSAGVLESGSATAGEMTSDREQLAGRSSGTLGVE